VIEKANFIKFKRRCSFKHKWHLLIIGHKVEKKLDNCEKQIHKHCTSITIINNNENVNTNDKYIN
jgi:hypothetical protein